MERALTASLIALLVLGTAPAPAEGPTGPPSGAPEMPAGELVEGVVCAADPSQTYTLYLPAGYSAERRWPTLLIFDPRGRGTLAAELFRDAAEAHGWILLASDNTRSDGSWEPNLKALAALMPELDQRWAVDRRRLYAAGFSGGAMVALFLARRTGSLAGVISAGSPWVPGLLGEEVGYAHFGTVGTEDFNFTAMHRLDSELERRGAPHRLESFEGPHRWMPPELARRAVEWMEGVAMAQGRRPVDTELAGRMLVADLARAQALEAGGEPLAALRLYRSAVAVFGPLEALSEPLRPARLAVERLEASAEVAAAERQERRWEEYETAAVARLSAVVGLLRSAEPPLSVKRLLAELRILELQKRAGEATDGGAAARRVLETIFTQLSFYLIRELFAEGSYHRAGTALEVALEIHDDRPGVWYNLACARAQSGGRKRALEALSQAVDHGWEDRQHLEADPDLESLRELPGYLEILARLGG